MKCRRVALLVCGAAQVDAVFAPYDRPDSPACALSDMRDGRIIYERGNGMANLGYDFSTDGGSTWQSAFVDSTGFQGSFDPSLGLSGGASRARSWRR